MPISTAHGVVSCNWYKSGKCWKRHVTWVQGYGIWY